MSSYDNWKTTPPDFYEPDPPECDECGYEMVWNEEEWICPDCGYIQEAPASPEPSDDDMERVRERMKGNYYRGE